jgi:hypothetical protein
MITSATYNGGLGRLVVTGTNIPSRAGANNDIAVDKFIITGDQDGTRTLTTTSVDVSYVS